MKSNGLLAAAITVALGTGSVYANPTNTNSADSNDSLSQTASATAAQAGDGSPQANEYSTASLSTSADVITTTTTTQNWETNVVAQSNLSATVSRQYRAEPRQPGLQHRRRERRVGR